MPTETLDGRRTVAERILAKSIIASNGCRLWTGHLDRDGYGRIGNGKTSSGQPRPCLVHREAYVAFVGPIAEGMTIDHTCHTEDRACEGGSDCSHRRCVEPSHLEQVTFAENTRRREVRLDRSRCRRGHLLDEANTRHRNGARECRACDALLARIRRSQKRARAMGAESSAPTTARDAARVHPLPDLGFGTPAGVSGTSGLGSAGAAVQAGTSGCERS